MDYRTDFYGARWHLDAAKRMLVVYDEYSEKRVLIGVIREAAKCVAKLVRAFLIMDKTRGDLDTFVNEVGPRYLDSAAIENLVLVLNIEREHKASRVELARRDKILLEVEGKWKVLEVSRLRELIGIVDEIVSNFPTDIKR